MVSILHQHFTDEPNRVLLAPDTTSLGTLHSAGAAPNNQHGPYSVMWISMFSARPLTGIHDEERAGKRSALRPPRGGRLAKSLPPPCWKYGILAPVLITFSRQRLTIGRQARAT